MNWKFIILLIALFVLFVGDVQKSDWELYTDDDFEISIEYPRDLITIQKIGKEIELFNSFPLRYSDPCDMMGTASPLEEYYNLKFMIRVYDGSIKNFLQEKESDTWFRDNYLISDNELKISPGFIDRVKVAGMLGYLETSGVEGCGQYEYFIPLVNRSKTLYILRPYIYEWAVDQESKVFAHKDYIEIEERDSIFSKVINSITILD